MEQHNKHEADSSSENYLKQSFENRFSVQEIHDMADSEGDRGYKYSGLNILLGHTEEQESSEDYLFQKSYADHADHIKCGFRYGVFQGYSEINA